MTRVTFASLLFAPVLYSQNPPPTCPVPVKVQSFRHLRDLPGPPREALQAKVKDIVDSDQPFDATDVVINGAHFNRFAFAWQTRERIVIATEHGGFAYWNPVYVATQRDIGAHSGPLKTNQVELVEAAHAQHDTLCSTLSKLLSQPQHAPSASPHR